MAETSIEWTQVTWNPVTGCNKVSPGCKYCYAERMSKRLKAMGLAKYSNEFRVTLHQDSLAIPLMWKTPRLIFVNSMSDLFHEEIPFVFIRKVFAVMREARWHQFQVLTKRAERLLEFNDKIDWPDNVWMGVSVENQDYQFRIDYLRKTNAHIKFLSLEPLLGTLPKLNLRKIDWVIVGGESGPNARPMEKDWVRQIREQCIKQHVPFFFKQWGGRNKKKAGRILDRRIWNQMPRNIQIGISK